MFSLTERSKQIELVGGKDTIRNVNDKNEHIGNYAVPDINNKI